ncbi:MAG: hypothetical protein KF850_26950 [Labilithrix sp.]|nr:hypothetical protein [Labilithrix sp.]
MAYVATTAGLVAIDEASARAVDLGISSRLMLRVTASPSGDVYTQTPFWGVRGGVPFEIPLRFVGSMAASHDGSMWLEQSQKLHVLQGDKLDTKIASLPPDCCLGIAIAADNVVFVSTFQGMGAAAGAAVDAKGAPRVYKHADGKWTPDERLEDHLLPKQRVVALTGGRRGEIDVVVDDSVIRRDAAGSWRKIGLQATLLKIGRHSLREGVRLVGSVGASGVLPLLTEESLRLVDPDGTVRRIELPVLPANVGAVAVDEGGRVWLGGLHGLHVLSAQGSVLAHWPAGALPGAPEQIVIVNGGPKELPAAPPIVKGRARGVLTAEGKPVADGEVELGPTASIWLGLESIRSDMRSSDQDAGALLNAGRIVTRTDANGAFVFEDVPRQHYDFVSHVAGRAWKMSPVSLKLADRCCASIADGQTVDLGTIDVR